MTQKRVVPIDGSTVSHHAIITLADGANLHMDDPLR
jgi:hypothetical protein